MRLSGAILQKKFDVLPVVSPLEGVAYLLSLFTQMFTVRETCWDGSESQPQSSHPR